MKLNVVVLAAGMGKRMRSEQPKVLHTIAGKPMLTHVLDTGRQLHADQLIVVIGHGGEQVQAYYGDTQDLAFVWQVPQQGTGDAVKQAIPFLKEAGADDMTLILYGDVPLVQSASLEHLLNECRQHQVCGVLTQNVGDPTGYGRIVRDAQGRIQRIVEQKDANPQELAITEINTGIIAAPTQQLIGWLNRLRNDNAQAEYYLTDVIAMAVAEGQTVASAQPLYEWETKGVNSRTQQAELECIYQTVLAERLLEEGVCLLDKTRIDVRGELQCGQDVRIDVGCVFEGRVVLGNRVTIGPYCVLKDVTIADDTVIEAYSHLVQAQVGSSAKVGPYARLRPGTQLADHTHVGNFVELKNTYLGEGSKANHLTYLGDAQIGSKVNIGAGVITVNYDGVNKFKTIIEDRAFVGSNSSLVAPLTVGQGATVGAGSTLTKDASAEQLTVARARAVTIASWKRPVKKT